jgi:hypothetical protein
MSHTCCEDLFAWNEFSAILRGISLDQIYEGQEEQLEHPRDHQKE